MKVFFFKDKSKTEYLFLSATEKNDFMKSSPLVHEISEECDESLHLTTTVLSLSSHEDSIIDDFLLDHDVSQVKVQGCYLIFPFIL